MIYIFCKDLGIHFNLSSSTVCLILANSVSTKCRPSKLIAIPFCKIVIDALRQGVHCFVSFFIINIEQIIVWRVSDRKQPYEEVLQK